MKQINALGKLNKQGGSYSLTAHMLCVTACFYAVVQLAAVRRALERVAGRPTTEPDLGKYSQAFQQRLHGSKERADHATAGAKVAVVLMLIQYCPTDPSGCV